MQIRIFARAIRIHANEVRGQMLLMGITLIAQRSTLSHQAVWLFALHWPTQECRPGARPVQPGTERISLRQSSILNRKRQSPQSNLASPDALQHTRVGSSGCAQRAEIGARREIGGNRDRVDTGFETSVERTGDAATVERADLQYGGGSALQADLHGRGGRERVRIAAVDGHPPLAGRLPLHTGRS